MLILKIVYEQVLCGLVTVQQLVKMCQKRYRRGVAGVESLIQKFGLEQKTFAPGKNNEHQNSKSLFLDFPTPALRYKPYFVDGMFRHRC